VAGHDARAEPSRVNVERLTNIRSRRRSQTGAAGCAGGARRDPIEKMLAEWPRDRVLFVCAEAGAALPIAEAMVAHKGRRPVS